MTITIKKSSGLLSLTTSSVNSIDNLPEKNKQLIRDAIVEELKAINIYEIMAGNTENEELKKIFLDIAQEEKVHVGELESLLRTLDIEQTPSIVEGFKEVEKKLEESM